MTPILADKTTARVFYWTRGDLERAAQYDSFRRLEQSGRLEQYLNVSRAGARNSLPMRFDLYSMQGFKSEQTWHNPLLSAVDVWDTPTAERLKWIGMFGAKYVFTTREVDTPLLKPIARDTVITYENQLALPRAFIVPETRVLDDLDRAFKELQASDFDPRQTVLLQTTVELPPRAASSLTPAKIFWLADEPEQIVLEVENPASGFLVLNDTFYPGWRAAVDGVATPIYRANVLARAVQLPAGTHRVEFVYEPASVRVGGGISLFVCLALGIFLIAQWGNKTSARADVKRQKCTGR